MPMKPLNSYLVEAHFQRARFFYKVELWEGKARNMVVAMRKAAKVIMARKNVVRLRHPSVTFRIEKMR